MTTLILSILLSLSAQAEGPCKDKREAKSAANKTFTECLKKWHAGMNPAVTDPTDDCVAKFQAVQSASKDIKACRAAVLKSETAKK